MAVDKTIQLKLELEVARANANVKKFNTQLQSMDKRTKEAKAKLAQLNLELQKLSTSKVNLKKATSEMNNLDKSITGVGESTGAATSATLELGRAISDAPYGIRGMANNVSQLASNIFFMSKKVDETTGKVVGLGGAFKNIGRSLTGSLGVLVAIQAVIAVVEYFSNSMNQATDDVESLNDSLQSQIDKLNLLSEELLSTSESIDSILGIDSFADGLKVINNEFSEFEKKYEDLKKNGDLSKGETVDLLNKYKQLLRVRGELEANIAELKEQEEEDDPSVAIIKRLQNEIKTNLIIKAELEDYFEVENKKGSSKNRVDRIFKEQVLDLQRFISQANREAELETEMSAERRLRIEFEYSKADLLLQKTTFVDKQKLRFKQYTESEAKRQEMSVEDFKKTQQYANEKAKLQQSIDDAEISHQEAHNALILLNEQKMFSARLDALTDFNNRIDKLNLQRAKNIQKLNKSSLGGVSAGSVGSPMSTVGAESVDTQVSDAEDYNELLRSQFEDDIVQKEIELRAKFDSEMQVQAELSKMRYNFNLEEMNREIELEQMKIDAKKSINQEYVSWFSGLGNLMRNLAGDNEALANIALVLQKGAEIANIVIKTQSANAQIGAIAAVQAQNPATAPLALLAPARITKNNIGSGIAIANILATTLKSQKKPSGSGSAGAGGSGGGGRTFDFNLVGSTGENQLAQGIAGQLGNPVQAYVVSSQMTSQQQLDNAIQTSATIGD